MPSLSIFFKGVISSSRQALDINGKNPLCCKYDTVPYRFERLYKVLTRHEHGLNQFGECAVIYCAKF